MEAIPQTANEFISPDTLAVSVTSISNIGTELKLFSAVYTLKNSAMKQYILDPLARAAIESSSKVAGMRYKGHVSAK